jgi:hypothetical protein
MKSLLSTTVLAGVLAAAPAASRADEALHLRAFAVDLNSGVRTGTVDLVVERWSTPEEIEKLHTTLVEKGGAGLLPVLQKIRPRCGYASVGGGIGWDIYSCREIPLPGGGRRILLATDRPVGFWEARDGGRSRDYEFSLAEIRLGSNGKGEGKAIPAAKLTWDQASRTLEIENYQREPLRLTDVTLVEPKKK